MKWGRPISRRRELGRLADQLTAWFSVQGPRPHPGSQCQGSDAHTTLPDRHRRGCCPKVFLGLGPSRSPGRCCVLACSGPSLQGKSRSNCLSMAEVSWDGTRHSSAENLPQSFPSRGEFGGSLSRAPEGTPLTRPQKRPGTTALQLVKHPSCSIPSCLPTPREGCPAPPRLSKVTFKFLQRLCPKGTALQHWPRVSCCLFGQEEAEALREHAGLLSRATFPGATFSMRPSVPPWPMYGAVCTHVHAPVVISAPAGQAAPISSEIPKNPG